MAGIAPALGITARRFGELKPGLQAAAARDQRVTRDRLAFNATGRCGRARVSHARKTALADHRAGIDKGADAAGRSTAYSA